MTPLVTQISWTNHLLILSGAKSAEERHFYMDLYAKEHFSKRKLEHKIDIFVNVYDDKLVLTYNYQHGTQTVTCRDVEDFLSSDLTDMRPIF